MQRIPFVTYTRMSEKIKGPEAASKRTVNAQDLNNGIRVSAGAVGLPADRFLSKSYREALATKNQSAGAQIEETCRLGGRSVRSLRRDVSVRKETEGRRDSGDDFQWAKWPRGYQRRIGGCCG